MAVQTGLDPLYNQIVSAVPQSDNFEQILGTIMLLHHPIPITYVALLIQCKPANIVESLLGLQFVLMIHDLPVQLSFSVLWLHLWHSSRRAPRCMYSVGTSSSSTAPA